MKNALPRLWSRCFPVFGAFALVFCALQQMSAQSEKAGTDLLGKPFPMKFTAVDGRKVDLATMRGKVVLIDFWATWCGPCVKEIPNVKATYDKLHPKGFEIVGISFDEKKAALQGFVLKQQMPWPHYFDGLGWKNKYGTQFGIHSIPTMWLVDKKGNLRELSARSNLESKVQKLLEEK
ncbi:MAG TPA: TlpA disulfide reductase family protein [Verrucomicrobiae bacterium]|nr:TlpA disulfide reductase family protein [Verrucomicrobiae bacterium]